MLQLFKSDNNCLLKKIKIEGGVFLDRTGQQAMVITPGVGIFEVGANILFDRFLSRVILMEHFTLNK